MRPAMYVFIRKDLGMSGGKIAAQVAQAACVIVEAEKSRWITHQWLYRGGHHATYVMEVADERELRNTQQYLKDRGFESFVQIDEGHTEVEPLTPTVLAVQPVNKDDPHVQATFGMFKLYRDTPDPTFREKVRHLFNRHGASDAHTARLGAREARRTRT